MESTTVLSLLDQLDDEIDDLEESLDPFSKTALAETSSKLPLLDKAKLYVLVTYAIESILFSYLRLNGVKAREHPVFIELTRVKQYFDKIKAAENPVEKRGNLSLDKGAASRIIKSGLVGNDKYDLERAEEQAKSRARAQVKLNELSAKMKQDELSKKRKADGSTAVASDSGSDSPSVGASEGILTAVLQTPPNKKKKRTNTSTDTSDSVVARTSESSKGKKKDIRKFKRQKKSKKNERDTKI